MSNKIYPIGELFYTVPKGTKQILCPLFYRYIAPPKESFGLTELKIP